MRLSGTTTRFSLVFLLVFCLHEVGVEARGGRGGGGRGGGGRGGGSRGGSRGSSGGRSGSSSGWGGGGAKTSGGFGRNVRVNSYRGGGGSTRSSVPLITPVGVGRSFFAPRTSTILFMTAGGMSGYHLGRSSSYGRGGAPYRGETGQQPMDETAGLLDTHDNTTAITEEEILMEKNLVILNPELPVLVAPTLAYFWGTANLPNATNGTNGCVEMKTANEHGMYTLCNISTMNRCHRSSAEVPDFQGKNITLKDGTPVLELAWLCPAEEGCCEWECCDVTYVSDETWMEWSFVFVLVIFFLAVAFKRARECLEERRLGGNVNRYQAGQPQRGNEGIGMNIFK